MIELGTTKVEVLTMDKKGEMLNAYSPLQNLINKQGLLGDFSSENLLFDRYTPVDILVTDEYDGSENLIINDDVNVPRLINNRFSVLENNTFNIPVHSGNAVTNVYEEDSFDKDTELLKLYDNIPSLTFEGISEGGAFRCGSYVFFFKLGDADGNLTNIALESGIVQIHVGAPKTKKIRMGLLDEDAGKIIKFLLEDIDAGFDYVRIFYERSSTDNSQALVKSYYMIDQNFPIRNGKCDILLTGKENTLLISKLDIQTEFADIQTAKTLDVVDNTLFLGNISAYEQDYQALQLIAWRIIPSVVNDEKIGLVQTSDYSFLEGFAYYDTQNSYYHVGYWPEEIYRFGVVFIYDNNLKSPVFNIQGCDLSKVPGNVPTPEMYFLKDSLKYENEPEDYIFRRDILSNSKGVVKLPNSELFTVESGRMIPKPIKIKFDWSNIIYDTLEHIGEDGNTVEPIYEKGSSNFKNKWISLFRKHNIKGFFFVRQKRIPTIIALGMVVGLTGKDYGSLPVLKNKNNFYITKSFLNSDRILLPGGSTVAITSNVKNQALLVPDYDINEATLNQIFTGLEFQLQRIGNIKNDIIGDHHFSDSFTSDSSFKTLDDIKLTAIPKNTKVKTDGTNYFSSLAGNPDEPYKTVDVTHKWNETPPQDLTASTSLVRGIWGSYVGMSENDFEYGDLVNIRLNTAKDENFTLLEFKKRFKDFSLYSAISPRINISKFNLLAGGLNITCSRGDCYLNVFTHRMMSNFVDTELPTNHKIVDPGCWAANYAVRCTAEIKETAHSNLTGDSDGFYIRVENIEKKSSIVSLIFGILTGNIGTTINAISDLASSGSTSRQYRFANEIVQSFEVYTGKDATELDTNLQSDDGVTLSTGLTELVKNGYIKKVNPKEQESLGGFNLKAIFKADDKWELHGLANINRADVNAVSFGSWITFPVCSSYNLALRDIDFNNATEEAKMNKKRSFYPYEEMNPEDHLLESGIINGAAKVSLSDNLHPAYTTIPFIRQEFFNRIYWSKPNVAEQFINSYRMIYNTQYREYNKEFGAITKIVALKNNLLVVFQHGIGVLPVNRSPLTEQEASPYLPLKSVLPALVVTLTADYGSMWKDSVLRTPQGIVYGIDTVAKKIWMTDGSGIKFISDHVITKFLNDHIDLSEFDYNTYQGHINVKTHYNEFKKDVMFTYTRDIPLDKDGNTVDLSGNLVLDDTEDPKSKIVSWKPGIKWNICYNEQTQLFVTFYDWYPVESCNVDNIFFTFDQEKLDEVYEDLINTNPSEVLSKTAISMNKVFMDKAFTSTVKVYIPDRTGIAINVMFETKGHKYVSFYFKDLKQPSGFLYANGWIKDYKTYLFGKDPDWHFVIVPLEGKNFLSLTYNGYYVSEVRFHDEDPKDIKDPVLKYYDFRNSEGPSMELWKHGMAGLYDNQGKIKPTHWYGKQHEFNFEFIVNGEGAVQKIFNNLLILSNKTAPYKFEYEVVGEGYDWYIYKEVINWANKQVTEDRTLELVYEEILTKGYDLMVIDYIDFPELFGFEGKEFKKIPFLQMKLTDQYQDIYYNEFPDKWHDSKGEHSLDTGKNDRYSWNTSETCLIEDEQLNEEKVHTESLGQDVKKYGRLRGNMLYLEDTWKVEIRPIAFKYAYLKDGQFALTDRKYESRHRDKFLRVKVRYDGKDLALIQAVSTLFDISYA